jgi:hypothetical protein
VENRVCLSRGVQVAGVAWRAVMRIMAGVGDLVQRIEDGRTGRVLGGWTIGRTCDIVCGLHHDVETRSSGFLVKPQNQGQRFVIRLASKPPGRFVSGLASKSVAAVSPSLASKPVVEGFPVWASKSAAMI